MKQCLCALALFASLQGICHGQELLAQSSNPQWTDHYQQALAEQSLDKGRSLMLDAKYAEAEQAFFNALQLVKINNGMATELQIPVLTLLIQSQLQQSRWDTIQQYLSYYDWLNGELYKNNILDYLRGSEQLSGLYLQAAADSNNPKSAHYLVASKNIQWNAVSTIEGAFGTESKELVPWLYRIVLSHFYQSSLVQRRGLTSYDYKTDMPIIVNGWSLSKNESLEKSYNIGVELLTRIANIELKAGNPQAQAMTALYLGDWESIFANGSRALNNYRQANKLLLNSGVPQESIDELFGQATVLPEAKFYSTFADLASHKPSVDSQITFRSWSANFPGAPEPLSMTKSAPVLLDSVSAKLRFAYYLGEADSDNGDNKPSDELIPKTNLQLLSISEDSGAARTQAFSEVSLLHLRPRLRGGRLVPSEPITVDYIFSRQSVPRLLTKQ